MGTPGSERRTRELLSYVDLEKRVRPDHPLRPIREIANTALGVLADDFLELYWSVGRPLAGDIAAKFLAALPEQPRGRRLLSSEHFRVDGTLIDAWASMNSFRPKGGGKDRDGGGDGDGRDASANFRGEKRSDATHESTPIRMPGSTDRGRGSRVDCASSPMG